MNKQTPRANHPTSWVLEPPSQSVSISIWWLIIVANRFCSEVTLAITEICTRSHAQIVLLICLLENSIKIYYINLYSYIIPAFSYSNFLYYYNRHIICIITHPHAYYYLIVFFTSITSHPIQSSNMFHSTLLYGFPQPIHSCHQVWTLRRSQWKRCRTDCRVHAEAL